MRNDSIRIPGPDHPITIEPSRNRVLVKLGHLVLADTREALTLSEADYPPVQYIPAADVNLMLLTDSERRTYCSFKGDCSYYGIQSGDKIEENAVWAYKEPYDAVSQIGDHYAFYPDRVDIILQG